VSDPKNISAAINKILDDNKLWKEFSENGMKNVKEHYTWKAHTKIYSDEIKKLISTETAKPDTFAPVGRKLLDMKKLIVSDIDHTLLGDDTALINFNNLLNGINSDIGFAVATGRTVDSAFEVLKENNVMLPIVIISSVGSEIYYNYKGELIFSKGWQAHIKYQFNRQKIYDLMRQLNFLQYQEEENQREFKISYYTSDNPGNLEMVKKVLMKNKMKANVIFSHGQFLDILPFRASKGKAIRYISYRWNIPNENILVAGDSGNDEEMLKGDLLGVVVGNHTPELDSLRGSSRIYFSKRNYAGGIIDGIDYYKFLTSGKGDYGE
jgi:sucrose-phosphate synthase